MSYTAPVKDMLFAIEHLANLEQIAQIPGFEDAGLDTASGAQRRMRQVQPKRGGSAQLESDDPIKVTSPPRPASKKPIANSPRQVGKACNTR